VISRTKKLSNFNVTAFSRKKKNVSFESRTHGYRAIFEFYEFAKRASYLERKSERCITALKAVMRKTRACMTLIWNSGEIHNVFINRAHVIYYTVLLNPVVSRERCLEISSIPTRLVHYKSLKTGTFFSPALRIFRAFDVGFSYGIRSPRRITTRPV